VPFVTSRWSTDQVLALAPDESSRRAAGQLAGPARWSGTGAAGLVVWGQCAGSGRVPYETIVDLSGPAYLCSCPSRKFPCKHALALLLNWAEGATPEADEAADFARSWVAARAARAARAAGVARGAEPARPARPGAAAADQRAAQRRVEQRQARVGAGLSELETWLRDQVRAGLSGTSGYRPVEQVAARMVDAQAPGVAGTLRGLSGVAGAGDGWPGQLLAEYARLHLLIRAHDRLDELPPGLAAVVRSHVGYPVARQDVLAGPAVSDQWLVIGVRDVLDGAIPARRTLLRGQRTSRLALLLSFDPRGAFAGDPDAALPPGLAIDADLHFYPGQPALRALIGNRRGEPGPAAAPAPHGEVGQLLDDWAAALAQDPWLASWPALLAGTPVPAGAGWQLADAGGRAVPLRVGGSGIWSLVAVSGGRPVTVAGEWSAGGLRPLTVWHGDQAVAL
jgi:SWIM zinc finger